MKPIITLVERRKLFALLKRIERHNEATRRIMAEIGKLLDD